MAHDAAQHADQQSPGRDSQQESGKHIVFALLIAAIIVFGARQISDHLVKRAPAVLTQPTATPAETDHTAEDEQIAADARKARQAREQALIEEDRVQRERKKTEALRARDEVAAASQAEEARREAAWQRFYTRPRKCDAAASDDATRIDCSNQYIRAKDRFEKLYADGKLR